MEDKMELNKFETKSEQQSGFTLIELSIVLVLIGLVIGGVLKGQELIASTRLKMAVSQWDALKSAFNTFQDKYQALPGDYSQAATNINTAITNIGNDSGVIGAAIATVHYSSALGAVAGANEHRGVWEQLSLAGLVASVTNTGVNWDLPSKISGSYFNVMYSTLGGRTAHWLRLQSGSGVTARTANPLTAKEASEIDRKYDDGVIGTGLIQGGSAVGATTCTYGTSATKDCAIVMEIF